MTLNLNQIT